MANLLDWMNDLFYPAVPPPPLPVPPVGACHVAAVPLVRIIDQKSLREPA